jgi:hypothetical protein
MGPVAHNKKTGTDAVSTSKTGAGTQNKKTGPDVLGNA